MAGKVCPNCGKFTFFLTNTGRACTNCKFKMEVPVNDGKGGKGTRCSNCGKHTVFNNKCTKCGATYSF